MREQQQDYLAAGITRRLAREGERVRQKEAAEAKRRLVALGLLANSAGALLVCVEALQRLLRGHRGNKT